MTPSPPRPALLERLRQWQPVSSVERMVLLTCLYVALVFNPGLWDAVLAGHTLSEFATWRLLIATLAALGALHFIVIASVATRWTAKPLLALVVVASAMAAYYIDRYAVFMDPDMLRNILHTEYKEARELLTGDFLAHVATLSALPLLAIWRMRLLKVRWSRALRTRLLHLLAAVGVAAGGLMLGYRDLAGLMREHKEVRYLVTPGNLLYASGRVLLADARNAHHVRSPVGLDAHVRVRAASTKPRLLVIVVGETVRAQNWGLNGYARDTTPGLRALNVVNFPDVQSCGTATEVSLPCMFSAVGRRDYDEQRILGQESLLHVLNHAGIPTLWRDNQTGCKGVCTGLPFQQLNAANDPTLCRDGLCFDDILLQDLQREVAKATGDLVVVLHPLGNHGPSYFLRYPESFRVFTPTCDSADLGACDNAAIVNSYDNAVRYADHFLSETIELLARQDGHDSALIYVSDHGESLGEQGFFLHGLPYAIAPQTQTAVPMIAWLSPGMINSSAVDIACLRDQSARPLAHDNLFHSVLGLLDVQTQVYEPSLDVFADCRRKQGMLASSR